MPTVLDILGNSTPVSEALAQKLGYVKAAIACRVFFYQQLDKGVCDASVNTIAQKLGMGKGTVSTNLKWLVENGYIKELGEHKKGNVSNSYVVTSKFYAHLESQTDETKRSADERSGEQRSADERERSGDERKRRFKRIF